MGYKSSKDRITLSGVKLYPHIGTTAEERASAQECLADLSVWGDFEAAAATDALDKSIDYCLILKTIQEIANKQDYVLVETLAYGIVRGVLQRFPVSRVRIKLRKRPAVLLDQLAFIEVEVEEP